MVNFTFIGRAKVTRTGSTHYQHQLLSQKEANQDRNHYQGYAEICNCIYKDHVGILMFTDQSGSGLIERVI